MSAIHATHPLVLEERQRSPDGAGGFTVIWAVLGTLWAEVKPGTGRDANGEEVILASLPLRITVRGAPPGAPDRPKPDQRFREGARFYRILAVTERDAAGDWLLCYAREEAPT